MLSYVFGKSKNKRGWLRVVEACMAIIILIGFVMIIMNKAEVKETNMQERVNDLVLKIEKDNVIRQEILNLNCDDLDCGNIILDYDYAFSIEDLVTPKSCEGGMEKPLNKEIFASSIIIASSENYKKFTLYIWE